MLDIHAIRKDLGLTQAELAHLLGVHPMTVSKWERGIGSTPTPYQRALLQAFQRAARRAPSIGEKVRSALVAAGVVAALGLLLAAALEVARRTE